MLISTSRPCDMHVMVDAILSIMRQRRCLREINRTDTIHYNITASSRILHAYKCTTCGGHRVAMIAAIILCKVMVAYGVMADDSRTAPTI